MATEKVILNTQFNNSKTKQFNRYKTGTLYIKQFTKDRKTPSDSESESDSNSDKTLLAKYDFIPQEDFQTTLTFDLENLYDSVMKKAGLAGQITNAIGGISFSDSDGYSSKFRNMPAQKSFSCVINDSVTLNFRYGLYREYNARSEVVNPICDIVKTFAPRLKYNDSDTKGNYIVQGPYASTLRLIKGAVKEEGFNPVKGFADILKETGENGVNAGITSLIYKFETIMNDSLDSTNMKYLNIRVGKFIWSYIVPKSISWKFDTSNVDENGNPMSGQIILSGLQFIYAPVQIIQTAGGKDVTGFFNFNEGIIGDLFTTPRTKSDTSEKAAQSSSTDGGSS